MDKLVWKDNGDKELQVVIEDEVLKLHSQPKTDFWRTPEVTRLNAHFGAVNVEGDFEFSIRIKAEYDQLYDQAGAVVYIQDDHWLKTGIEMVDNLPHISVVSTHPYSDWSVVPLLQFNKTAFHNETLHLKLQRRKQQLSINYQIDSEEPLKWRMIREVTGFFPQNNATQGIQVGLMAASPQSDVGFNAVFSSFLLNQ